MSELHLIRQTENAAGDVVFVHGLGGHWHETWSINKEQLWPAWLGEDLADARVWLLEYDATTNYWRGSAMPMSKRASEVMSLLIARGLGARPIVFVCHSLGGLLVKNLLRISMDAAEN